MSCSRIGRSLTRGPTNGQVAKSITTRMVASALPQRVHPNEERDMESARYTAGSCRSAKVSSKSAHGQRDPMRPLSTTLRSILSRGY